MNREGHTQEARSAVGTRAGVWRRGLADRRSHGHALIPATHLDGRRDRMGRARGHACNKGKRLQDAGEEDKASAAAVLRVLAAGLRRVFGGVVDRVVRVRLSTVAWRCAVRRRRRAHSHACRSIRNTADHQGGQEEQPQREREDVHGTPGNGGAERLRPMA